MSQKDRSVFIVSDYDLAEAAANAHHITDLHGQTGLEIRLACAGNTLCGQQGMSYDKTALQFFVFSARCAVIIIAQCIQIVLFYHIIGAFGIKS